MKLLTQLGIILTIALEAVAAPTAEPGARRGGWCDFVGEACNKIKRSEDGADVSKF